MNAQIKQAAREARPWIVHLARIGFAAKGVVYMLIGVLAAGAAIGGRGKVTGSKGALKTIVGEPFGRWMLAIIAAGLFGYAAWRVLEAVNDPKRHGTDAKGLALRIGSAAKAIAYAALGTQAARLALGGGGRSGGDDHAAHRWTGLAMDQPFGRLLVAIAGAVFIGYGIYQCFKSWKSKLSDDLSLASMAAEARGAIVGISRFGIAARGIVFMVIGTWLLRAARHANAAEAKGVGGALRSVGQWSWGATALAVVATGLLAYGIYQLVNARYRRIYV